MMSGSTEDLYGDAFFEALFEAAANYREALKFNTAKFHDSLLNQQVEELFDASSVHPAPYRFFKVCETVSDCYPDDLGSDNEILAHTLTPILIRYLVPAMRQYYSEAESSLTTSQKAQLLAKAMGLQGGKRGGARRGALTSDEESQGTFLLTRQVAQRVVDGEDPKEAFSDEFCRLYVQWFRSDSNSAAQRAPAQTHKNLARFLEVLRLQGVSVLLTDEEAQEVIFKLT